MIAPKIVETANSLGMNPLDLATIISYETAGTFDPTKRGPTTKWGQHRGLIQFGQPQAKQYGVDWSDPVNSQLGAGKAVEKYFRSSGWKPGMSVLDAYSIVNAGAPGKYNASDTAAGGAPGTVRDKVENQFAPHRRKAEKLLLASNDYNGTMTDTPQRDFSMFDEPWEPAKRYGKQQAQPAASATTESSGDKFAMFDEPWEPAKRYLPPTPADKNAVVAPGTQGDIGSMTAKQLVAAYPGITGDVPPIPGSQEEQARARYFELSKAPEPTIAQKAVGAGEAGLSMLSGMTTGTAGAVAGSIKGIADTVMGGKYGTSQGAQDAAKTAGDWSAALTYVPRTAAGQQYAGAVGEAVAPLQAVAPLAQMQTLGAMSRGAALPRTAARTAEKSAVSTAAADVANAKNYGIPVMTSDINAPTTWGGRMAQAMGERIPVVGTGGQRAAQQSGRVGAVQDFLRNYGAENTTPAINDVTASLLQKRGADLSKYSAMKNEAINRNPGGVVPMQATNAAIDAQIAKLNSMNTQAVKPLVAKLEDYKTAFSNQDMPTVELLRKQLGDELQSPDMATVKTAAGQAASSVYGGLKRDMGDYIKATGDRRDFDKWQVANARLSEMIGETGNTGLKAALKKGEATPETIRSLLFSKKPSDLELLRKNLTPEGRNSAKTAIMQEAYAKIGAESSPERFVTQMDKLATQTGAMLTMAEKAELKGLVDALQLTKRAGMANVKPVTGAELTGFATPAAATYMMGGNPVAGLAATAVGGLIAQAYESPAMRNMMIALGKTTDRVQKQRIYDSMLFMANNPEVTAAAAGQTGGLLSVPASQGLLDR